MDYGPSLALESDTCVVIEVEASNPNKCNDCGRPRHKTKGVAAAGRIQLF